MCIALLRVEPSSCLLPALQYEAKSLTGLPMDAFKLL